MCIYIYIVIYNQSFQPDPMHGQAAQERPGSVASPALSREDHEARVSCRKTIGKPWDYWWFFMGLNRVFRKK